MSTPPDARSLEGAARVVLRPIGNPLPLGFIALAGGTLVVSGLQLGWLDPSDGGDVALILIGFVFPLQLVAAIYGYLARDVVAGTGMGVLAGTWLSIGLVGLTSPPGATSDALGLFLLLAGAAMLVPAAVAATEKVMAAAVLLTTSARFSTTGVYELSSSAFWGDLAGVIGLLLCGLALYTALAMALEDARHRTVLPLLRRGTGRESLAGTPRDQLRGVDREAGVRNQL